MLRKIFDTMKDVIETTIKHDAHYSDFPKHYLIHERNDDGTCHHTGKPIQKTKVGGRTTYFSEGWQEK